MIPSSSSSGLSAPISSRPSSSLSVSRPSSSASHRPPSSLSTTRPSTSTVRPHSRYSQRPHSRHARSRLVPVCQTLIAQVTGLLEDGTPSDEGGEKFRSLVEYAVKSLESTTIHKAAAGVDMGVVDRQISGLALKSRINSRDAHGEALEISYKKLKDIVEGRENDLDQEIQTSRLPDHLQFLLTLSEPSSPKTLSFAKEYLENANNPVAPPPALTWAEILAEEPFEGEHWEGIYDGHQNDWDTTPSLSPLNSDDLALDNDDSLSTSDYEEPASSLPKQVENEPWPSTQAKAKMPYTYAHRKVFEDLRARQYWRDGWTTDADPKRRFDLWDPSTLGPALTHALARQQGGLAAHGILQPEKFIDEEDLVREVLIALQGRNNIVLSWRDGAYTITPSTPRLIHLSIASQSSILSSLSKTAATVENLRRFTASIFLQSRSQYIKPSQSAATYIRKATTTRTCEAFADAIDHEIRSLDAWCARREEVMCRASAGIDEDDVVVSLLGTEKAVRDQYETSFEVLLDVVQNVFDVKEGFSEHATFPAMGRRSPAAVTAFLLDSLFSHVQEHLERGDTVTSDTLMRVFVRSAEPVWGMIGKWLKDGMGLGLAIGRGGVPGQADELDEEFFIESTGVGVGLMAMGLLDPEFWKEGYSLREGVVLGEDESRIQEEKKAIPAFLEHVAELVLGTGKAVGLIRALGIPPSANGFGKWRSFAEVVSSNSPAVGRSGQDGGALFSVSVDTLSRIIYDGLLPRCQATGSLLAKVLVDDCDLWRHLGSIEDLYLMRKGDAVSHYIDVLFAKMDTHQSWSDFHFMNTAFNDVVEANLNAGAKEWIQPSLVRLSYRGTKEKEKSINKTVKAIDGLLLGYAIPFPLTYIFRPRIIQVYGDIFVFLLQVRRAKSVLERILVRGERGRDKKLKEEFKAFYAMRSRLSWFINTLLNFFTTYVIHAQVLKFHDDFRDTKSLDEMIQVHDEHLDKIQGRCLLKSNTSALHRSIISILDLSLHFSDMFATFAGDTTTTLDVSRQSISMRRHRSRRQRRLRRDVIGFSQSLHESEASSEDDDEEVEVNLDTIPDTPDPSYSMMSSAAGEDFFTRVDKMSTELDGLVRFVRRGVESLAGGLSEAAPAFGVLAFALEDWDM